ncbi:hypothetical protein ACIOK4_42090 [Streptomyces bottropensis]|uniref:hypothetical protein n=1 Tax=Streptomyces bottropensis TaxID=42235 RepID=UPI0037B9790A
MPRRWHLADEVTGAAQGEQAIGTADQTNAHATHSKSRYRGAVPALGGLTLQRKPL